MLVDLEKNRDVKRVRAGHWRLRFQQKEVRDLTRFEAELIEAGLRHARRRAAGRKLSEKA